MATGRLILRRLIRLRHLSRLCHFPSMSVIRCHLDCVMILLHSRGMEGLNLQDCLIYLGDIIIFSLLFDKNMERLQAVLDR